MATILQGTIKKSAPQPRASESAHRGFLTQRTITTPNHVVYTKKLRNSKHQANGGVPWCYSYLSNYSVDLKWYQEGIKDSSTRNSWIRPTHNKKNQHYDDMLRFPFVTTATTPTEKAEKQYASLASTSFKVQPLISIKSYRHNTKNKKSERGATVAASSLYVIQKKVLQCVNFPSGSRFPQEK